MKIPNHSGSFHHPELDQIYTKIKISPAIPRSLKHRHLAEKLESLQKAFPSEFKLEIIGQSVEGKDIYLVSLGAGKRSVLMWSQMHGNEPTATNALLDIFAYLLRYQHEIFVREILSDLKIYAIPMLNPDGAEYDQRRNAQGLDINRDARELATPEARILKSIRDRLQPDFGFNLHDQNGRRTVGNTNKIVSIALLVPPVDESENETSNTFEAKKVASVICQALSPYLSGHIARYDASFMSRAFGDNFQKAGTRTILIESGGWYADDPEFLVKMNFIAILEACHAIATNSFQNADPALYATLPQNDKELFDLLIRQATIYAGVRDTPFVGDIGINYTEMPVEDGIITRGRITDLGDMGIFAAKETIDASGMVALPGLIGMIGMIGEYKGIKIANDVNFEDYLKKGYTTLLLPYRFHENERLAELIKKLRHQLFPLNFGFVASLHDLAQIPATEQATFLGDALFDGALAVLNSHPACDALHPFTYRITSWLNRNTFSEQELQAEKSLPGLLSEKIYPQNYQRAAKLGLHERGRIRIGDFADIVLYRQSAEGQLQLEQAPEMVLVNGRVSFKYGDKIFPGAGNLLIR